ncbi:hypothetical protein D5S17_35690 [Pseudonocardiaceae bacterium YIM PH 21723]|nr:hypothetical protein D5S17_35690 [Pseudonocardiaceae bacterium YIM PH 21723]
MLLLNGGGLRTLKRCREQYPAGATHLGRLARPRCIGQLRETLDAGFPVGIDNDAFCRWDLKAFAQQVCHIERALFGRVLSVWERVSPLVTVPDESWALLGRTAPEPLAAWHPNLLWMTAPDVPFDARATLQSFLDWSPLLAHLPMAYCVQDGARRAGIPWDWPNLTCLFMAGSTEYKLGPEMAAICREGKERGLLIHGGRVNSRRRIRYMLSLGVVDSIDGTGFDLYRDTHLEWGLREVSATNYQLSML